jgi:nucleotide-binding universal stress UspA family protein
MTEELARPVVVGVDGSTASAAAVDVAAVEAIALGVPLKIVHAYVWPMFYASLANVPYRSTDWEPSEETWATVNAVARRVANRHPELPLQTAVFAGGGAPVLVDESAHATLVVVGARGAAGFAGLLGGSVASHVASHARCPVIVVPARTNPDSGRVCVGVDADERSHDALRFACDWARRRGATVDAIHVVGGKGLTGVAARRAAQMLDSVAAEAQREFPTVDVRPVLSNANHPAEALVEASRTARLVVVGSRERGELLSIALGSVGHGLIRRAVCPIAVVHGWSRDAVASIPAPVPGSGH